MQLKCQQNSIKQLADLALSYRQSVLIEGVEGSGKTYLAKQYANMLHIDDYVQVAPKVADIREVLDQSLHLENKLLICIENLDLGVASAAYTLLKSLEEPLPNLIIVITCRNMQRVPDTIISRSAIVSVDPPVASDLVTYANEKDLPQANLLQQKKIWSALRTFSDIEYALSLNIDQLAYYENIAELCKFTDNVSTIAWNMKHANSQECNVKIIIRLIMKELNTPFVTTCCVSALDDMSQGRIAEHAILSKLAFNLKYCE